MLQVIYGTIGQQAVTVIPVHEIRLKTGIISRFLSRNLEPVLKRTIPYTDREIGKKSD